jgi:hypothetical protein
MGDVLSACFVSADSLVTGTPTGDLLLWDVGGKRAGFGVCIQVRGWQQRVGVGFLAEACVFCTGGALTALLAHTTTVTEHALRRPSLHTAPE